MLIYVCMVNRGTAASALAAGARVPGDPLTSRPFLPRDTTLSRSCNPYFSLSLSVFLSFCPFCALFCSSHSALRRGHIYTYLTSVCSLTGYTLHHEYVKLILCTCIYTYLSVLCTHYSRRTSFSRSISVFDVSRFTWGIPEKYLPQIRQDRGENLF